MRKFIRKNSARINQCVLQNATLVCFMLLFTCIYVYMASFEKQSLRFHHNYQPVPCLVTNIVWDNNLYGNITILVQNNFTIHKNHVTCLDIPDAARDCINQTFTGYFNFITQDLLFSDPFSWSMVVSMLIFGTIGIIIMTMLCWNTCKTNTILYSEYQYYYSDRQLSLLGI